jgi:hypothetical protein
VGIGTSSPVAPLTINDKATFSFNSSDFALGHQLYYDGAGNDRWERLSGNAGSAIYQTAGNVLFYRTAAGGSTGDAVTPTESMRIDSAGSLIIGSTTASVNHPLVVHQNTTNQHHVGGLSGGLTNNTYYTGSAWANRNTGTGGAIFQLGTDGTFALRRATSGSSPTVNYSMYIDGSGKVGVGTTSPTHQLDVQITATNTPTARFLNKGSVTGYTNIVAVDTYQSNSVNHQYLVLSSGNGSAISDNEFNFRGDGQAYADGSWNGGGADYAEYFEWADGNSSSQDRVGYSVSLVNNKIKIAESGETVIGVISGNPAVVGDNSWNSWKDKYQKDDYGRYIRNSDGHRISNPDYDNTLEYVKREERKEWDIVGLMGKLRIKKGQQTGTNWIKMRDISATVEEWLVR